MMGWWLYRLRRLFDACCDAVFGKPQPLSFAVQLHVMQRRYDEVKAAAYAPFRAVVADMLPALWGEP